MPAPKPPCRVFVFLARQAPYAMILRRGPSAWVQSLGWDTKTDTFEPGHWLRGRIYERKCDLSPDGEHFVYFTFKANRRTYDDANDIRIHKDGNRKTTTGYEDSWTAISRPPWLTAAALWPQGTTYDGGGLFLGNKEICLQAYHPPHIDHLPPVSLKYNNKYLGSTFTADIFAARLKLGGWELEATNENSFGVFASGVRPRLWKKLSPDKKFHLMLLEDDSWIQDAAYSNEYRIIAVDSQQEFLLEGGLTWADYDQRGRLVFACDGQIWADESGTGREARMLIDLNPNKPEAIESPAWAKTW